MFVAQKYVLCIFFLTSFSACSDVGDERLCFLSGMNWAPRCSSAGRDRRCVSSEERCSASRCLKAWAAGKGHRFLTHKNQICFWPRCYVNINRCWWLFPLCSSSPYPSDRRAFVNSGVSVMSRAAPRSQSSHARRPLPEYTSPSQQFDKNAYV